MKKIIIWILLPILLCFGISCSNEIDLTSDWKDIPVVYGFLSATDSVHYLRVEKAFIDPTASALDIAKIPDSLYYDNATVQVQKVGSNDAPIIFQKVNAEEEGFTREDGVFATAPNFIYKHVFPNGENWTPGATYEFQLNRGDQLPLVTASTQMLNGIDLRAPKDPDNFNYLPFNWGNPNYALEVTWRTDEIPGFFDVVLVLHINEFDVNNPTLATPLELEWNVAQNLPATEASNGIVAMKVKVFGSDFFNYVGNAIEKDDSKFRRFESVDIIVRSGGREIKEYIDIGLVNSGITSSQLLPTYTNLSEGFGIFSSIDELRVNDHIIDNITRDSLVDGVQTKDLNFQY